MFNTDGFAQDLLGRIDYTKFPPQRSFRIPSTTSRRKIKINFYEPKNFDMNKRYPVHLNFHGSGFMICMLGTDGDFCHLVSQRTGAIVLDCDYAKSPEYPFPAAPDDVRDIIAYVNTNKEGYFDTSRITIGGFSAGGTLALTAGVGQPSGTLKGIISIYPSVELSLKYAIENPPVMSGGNVNSFPSSFIKMARDCYVPPGTDMQDPRLSPVNVPTSLLPEHILIVVCEEDALRDEAVEYGKKLKAEGIKVVVKEMKGIVHYWDKWAKIGEETPTGIAKRETYQAAVDMLNLVFKSY
ncbi:Alpha/Beta hydrolase protein [Rhizoctonia solani]|nr:Alpha/Beta hydrolase protein [Rhizoctonia solani]